MHKCHCEGEERNSIVPRGKLECIYVFSKVLYKMRFITLKNIRKRERKKRKFRSNLERE